MPWRSIDVMKRIFAFLLMAIAALPLRAQLEFLAPVFGKKLLYGVEYTSPMGNGEFYFSLASERRGGTPVCDIVFYEDSLLTLEYSSSSITYRDSAEYYLIGAKDIIAFLLPNISGLRQTEDGSEVAFPKITAPGDIYEGSSVKLLGTMGNMAVTMDVSLGEIVVHPSEPVVRPVEIHGDVVSVGNAFRILREAVAGAVLISKRIAALAAFPFSAVSSSFIICIRCNKVIKPLDI